jgi:hypothetical protein
MAPPITITGHLAHELTNLCDLLRVKPDVH